MVRSCKKNQSTKGGHRGRGSSFHKGQSSNEHKSRSSHNRILAQHGNSRLIAQNMDTTQDTLYKEFLAFKAAQQHQRNTQGEEGSSTEKATENPSYEKI